MSDIEEKINKIITESILPSIQMHGGHVELQSFKDGIVTVFLSGACSGCAMSTLTLKMGIENMLKYYICLLYTSPSPRDGLLSRMPSSA